MQRLLPLRPGGGLARGLPAVLSVASAFIIWEIYVWLLGISSLVLPTSSRVIDQMVLNRGILWDNTHPTIRATPAGFGVSVTVAFNFLALLDFMPSLRRALFPIFVVSQTLPLVAIAPLVVLWFGFDLTPKILLVTLVTFFPLLVALVDEYEATDP